MHQDEIDRRRQRGEPERDGGLAVGAAGYHGRDLLEPRGERAHRLQMVRGRDHYDRRDLVDARERLERVLHERASVERRQRLWQFPAEAFAASGGRHDHADGRGRARHVPYLRRAGAAPPRGMRYSIHDRVSGIRYTTRSYPPRGSATRPSLCMGGTAHSRGPHHLDTPAAAFL